MVGDRHPPPLHPFEKFHTDGQKCNWNRPLLELRIFSRQGKINLLYLSLFPTESFAAILDRSLNFSKNYSKLERGGFIIL